MQVHSASAASDMTSTLEVREEGGTRRRVGITIAILFLLQLVDGLDQIALAVVAPKLGPELGIGYEWLGLAFTAALIGTAFGAVAFGTFSDYAGRKFALCLSAFLFAGGSLATLWVGSGLELMILRFLTGIALGGLFPVVNALVFETVQPRVRTTAITFVAIGAGVGGALCGPIFATIEPAFGWRSIFVVGFVAPTLLGILAAILIPADRDRIGAGRRNGNQAAAAGSDPKRGTAALFADDRWKVTLLIWLAFTAIAIPMYFSISWLPTLAGRAGLASGIGPISLGVYSLTGVLVAVVTARAVDRWGLPILAATLVCGAPAYLLLGNSFGDTTRYFIAVAFAGATTIGSINVLIASIGEFYEDDLRARGIGWAVAVTRLFAAFAPGLGGFMLAQAMTVQQIFLIIAIFPPIAAASVFALRNLMLKNRRS